LITFISSSLSSNRVEPNDVPGGRRGETIMTHIPERAIYFLIS